MRISEKEKNTLGDLLRIVAIFLQYDHFSPIGLNPLKFICAGLFCSCSFASFFVAAEDKKLIRFFVFFSHFAHWDTLDQGGGETGIHNTEGAGGKMANEFVCNVEKNWLRHSTVCLVGDLVDGGCYISQYGSIGECIEKQGCGKFD